MCHNLATIKACLLKDVAMPSNHEFERTIHRDGDRLLIESACSVCHESRVVSALDGSIDEWEAGHECLPVSLHKKPSAAAADIAERQAKRKI